MYDMNQIKVIFKGTVNVIHISTLKTYISIGCKTVCFHGSTQYILFHKMFLKLLLPLSGLCFMTQILKRYLGTYMDSQP